MPRHHITANQAPSVLFSSSRERVASTTADTGWFLANGCTQDGIVATGTNALLGFTRKNAKKEKPVAASGELSNVPTAAESHEKARMNSNRMAKANARLPGVAVGRNPTRSATTKTMKIESPFRTRLAMTWPPRMETPGTSSDLN